MEGKQKLPRRWFLRQTARGIAGAVLAGESAAARARGESSPQTGAPRLSVASRTIKIGMSAAFTGTAAALGTELYRGAQAYYDEINDRGGIHGRPISVAVLDDRYEPLPCVMNTLRLLEEEGVFLLSGYVGTPTLTRALPFIKQYAQEHDEDLAVVGVFTGAQPQRESPYVEYVFNIRASYRQEMMALVDQFWRAGAREFGAFYQIDAYGRSGTDGVARGLARRGATIAAEATYARGARFEDDMSLAVKALQEGRADVVLCTGAYQGCAAFIRSARDLGWNVPISNLSFVGSEALLGLLTEHGRKTGRDYTRALVNSQVVPSYDDETLPGVREYRALMDKNNPAIPHSLRDPRYTPRSYSFISLEGFINAKVIVEGLRRAGPHLTRRGFRQGLESLRHYDLGIGAPLSFGANRHQGLDSVYFTRVENDRWVPITDWKAAMSV
ncbi:MAG TPA: ABC transporter substrate-binding protein [Burkholderiales bacterium]|nr:ABC transporter substrate-binding protein [Burkholderiales bacterium]